MSSQKPSRTPPPGNGNSSEKTVVKEVELLRVIVARDGKQVSANWALHPQMKHDLLPDQLKELTDLMGKVTGIVGGRFSEILATAEPDPPGNA
ncbi:MAG: hypothetical protein HZB35_09325 [Nitrospirae bacterium]|nr:hypothetical protein [Nitrospirota bacterium]